VRKVRRLWCDLTSRGEWGSILPKRIGPLLARGVLLKLTVDRRSLWSDSFHNSSAPDKTLKPSQSKRRHSFYIRAFIQNIYTSAAILKAHDEQLDTNPSKSMIPVLLQNSFLPWATAWLQLLSKTEVFVTELYFSSTQTTSFSLTCICIFLFIRTFYISLQDGFIGT
jgi:hypothetical protein